MHRHLVAGCLTVIVCAWGTVGGAVAQPGLTLGANVIFYGDNTEFRNPFREGETLFGAAGRLDAGIDLGGQATLALGVFGNSRFGGSASFERIRPVLALTVAGRRSRFIIGTLDTPRVADPPGPDATGPHGLLPPIQRETLAFERAYEAGLQWTFEGRRLAHDLWLNWQRLNTRDHRERLDAGGRASWRLTGPLSLPLQAHIVHEGGQLFASGPVRDSLAVASGIVLSNRPASAEGDAGGTRADGVPAATPVSPLVSLEVIGLWSRDTPDREIRDRTRNGGAFFGRAAVETRAWRAHLIAWRGDDYLKDEGDPNYLSRRRDGTRYRGVRDYAEAGLTRVFRVSRGALIEASFRLHRIERHYEYSYRILAVARARARVRR